MIGSLINLLTRRPDLIIDHVAAYAALAQNEIDAAKHRLAARVVAGVLALAFGTASLVLAGVALMLATALPQIDNVWALYAAPIVSLLIALLAVQIARNGSDADRSSSSLGDQFRRDLAALKVATGARS